MTPPTVVVLAAGLGTRLGRRHPKPLTHLHDGRTILQQQLDHVRTDLWPDTRVVIVVGYKKELVMEAAAADATFVYNDLFDETNTSKSLLRALRMAPPGDVLWLNGDVVFTPGLLAFLRDETAGGSFVAVNTARVAEEEVKYTLDEHGHVAALSKQVVGGLGEAIGINFVTAADRELLIRHLDRVEAQDYFEKGLENAIVEDGLALRAVDVSRFGVVEVDFDDDLDRANRLR